MLNADVTACPSGFTYMYDACYAVPVQATSWIAANDVAADLGGGLASIQSLRQNRWLAEFLRCKLGLNGPSLWLGLNSISSAWSFVWTDSQPSSVSLMRNCVSMTTASGGSSGLWSDSDCSVLLRPLVRYTAGVPAVRFMECK